MKENVQGNLDSQNLPMTKQILSESLDCLNKVLSTSEPEIIKKILKKLEKSMLMLDYDSAKSYNLFRYVKRIEHLVEEK